MLTRPNGINSAILYRSNAKYTITTDEEGLNPENFFKPAVVSILEIMQQKIAELFPTHYLQICIKQTSEQILIEFLGLDKRAQLNIDNVSNNTFNQVFSWLFPKPRCIITAGSLGLLDQNQSEIMGEISNTIQLNSLLGMQLTANVVYTRIPQHTFTVTIKSQNMANVTAHGAGNTLQQALQDLCKNIPDVVKELKINENSSS